MLPGWANVDAVPVAEIIELPRLACGASASDYVLIDRNFDGAKVASKVACIGIGLGNL
jgi:hypothetical protein